MEKVALSCLVLACGVFGQRPFYSGLTDEFGNPVQPMAFSMAMIPTAGNGRTSTGNPASGPVQFPVSPESGETSGVTVGASGYGFIPPGIMMILQSGRGKTGPSPPSSFSTINQPFSSSFFNFS